MGLFHTCPQEPDNCPVTDTCANPDLCPWDHEKQIHRKCKLGIDCRGMLCPYDNHIVESPNILNSLTPIHEEVEPHNSHSSNSFAPSPEEDDPESLETVIVS
jgi:hypothetical protein